MQKKERVLKANDLKRMIKRKCTISRRNCVKYWGRTSRDHFLVMCQICFKLAENGWEFFTEAEGVNDKWRADIVAIHGDVGQIIEVLHTESEERYMKKKDTYPSEFILRGVRTKDFKIEEFDI